MTRSRDFLYAKEKLYLAVSHAATAKGDACARLEGVYWHIQVLRANHLPPEAWKQVAEVLKSLTEKKKDELTAAYVKLGRGVVAANVKRMKNPTAAKLLKRVWEAFEIVQGA